MTKALVFEKGRDEDRIVTSRKGGGTFRIDVEGKAAHAGNSHDKGVNAIHALALLVPRIEALTDYDRGVTVNVGLFSGGTAKNTVAQHAHCIIDARFVSVEDAEAFQGTLEALVDDFKSTETSRLKGARFEVSGDITRPPMPATAETKALCTDYEKVAARVGLGTGEAPRQGGFSDSNLLAALDIPTIDGLGPFGAGAHSLDEWCDLVSLRQRTKALALYLMHQA